MSNPETPPTKMMTPLELRTRQDAWNARARLAGNQWHIRGYYSLIAKDYGDAADTIEALRRRVEELEAREQWQPIETAPKDGTEIVVSYFDHEINDSIDAVVWDNDDHEWAVLSSLSPQWPVHLDAYTHWIPLPKSPVAPSSVQPSEQAEGGEG
jgi:hypothetical protein